MNALLFFWVILGLLFFILEIGHPGLLFFLSFCVGSLFAGVCHLLGYSFPWQLLNFFIGTLIALLFFKLCFKKMHRHTHTTNSYALIGKPAVVTQEISWNQPGYIKINGEYWLARTAANTILEIGTPVKIIGMQGAHCIVEILTPL